MNQKTKQLLEAAGFEYIAHDNIGWAGNHNASLAKLVELVVRECADVAYKYNRCDWVDVSKSIKQHFGVEP